MTIAIGAHDAKAAAASNAINTTGGAGTVFYVSVGWYGNVNITGVTATLNGSSDGNTYSQVQATIQGNDALFRSALFKCEGGTGGNTHVFTAAFSGAPTVQGVLPVEVIGATTSTPTDQAPVGLKDTHSDATPYLSTTTGATSQARELALAFTHTYTNSAGPEAHTWNNSYTAIDSLTDPATWTAASGYKVLSATGTQQSSLSASGATATDAITFIVTVKEAAVAATPGNTLVTQRRAPGFPPRAPRPGIVRLNTGILQPAIAQGHAPIPDVGLLMQPVPMSAALRRRAPGPPQPLLGTGLLVYAAPIVNVTGTGDAAMASFAASGVGLLIFSATGSAALSAFTIDAAGMEVFTGTSSAALSAFACSSSGLESFSATATAACSPFGASGTSAETFSGSASAAIQPFATTADGLTGFFGTGDVALSAFACSSAALETFTGTASAACSPFAADSTGSESYTGTASAACSPFATTASGFTGFSGTGTAAVSPFAAASSGLETFTGTATAATSPFAATGSGLETFTGTASIACSPFAAAGVGGGGIFGTGTATLSAFACTSSGLETFTGTGTAALAPFALLANGLEAFTGSASAAMQSFAAAAIGAQGVFFAGSASVALSPFAATASGAEDFFGTASAAIRPFAASGSSSLSFIGTGDAALQPFAADSIGFVGDFIGIGAVAMSPFSVGGIGFVPIIFQAPDARLERVATVKSRAGLRVATITRR